MDRAQAPAAGHCMGPVLDTELTLLCLAGGVGVMGRLG